MQAHHKLEMAMRPNKCSPEVLKYCSDYYHSGRGKITQKKYLSSLSPEEKRARLDKTNAWKRRNVVRIGLLRWATSCKGRAAKKNPGIANVEPWALIGCNVVEFQSHVESMFRDGIGWHNRKEWELDHIRPLCEFDLTDMAQVRECLHYSNVQILVTGPHWEKAKSESRAFMEKIAREHWIAHESGDYPEFKTAWMALTKFRAARRGK
jgi:hypothetical protein